MTEKEIFELFDLYGTDYIQSSVPAYQAQEL